MPCSHRMHDPLGSSIWALRASKLRNSFVIRTHFGIDSRIRFILLLPSSLRSIPVSQRRRFDLLRCSSNVNCTSRQPFARNLVCLRLRCREVMASVRRGISYWL